MNFKSSQDIDGVSESTTFHALSIADELKDKTDLTEVQYCFWQAARNIGCKLVKVVFSQYPGVRPIYCFKNGLPNDSLEQAWAVDLMRFSDKHASPIWQSKPGGGVDDPIQVGHFPWRGVNDWRGVVMVKLNKKARDLGMSVQASVLNYLAPSLFERSAQITSTRIEGEADNPELTKREIEVLNLLKNGYSLQSTAEHLNISIHTVAAHRRNIYRKFDVRNGTQAGLKALDCGII